MNRQNVECGVSLVTNLELLEDLYEVFNKQFFESALSKKPVITLSQKGTRRSRTRGWCTRSEAWEDINAEKYYEINICPEHIDSPFEDVCGVLLHEMVHLLNRHKKVQDCSRSSQYHNKKFKMAAELHGLIVTKHPSRGFSQTSLKPETLAFIKTLENKSFTLFRSVNVPVEPPEEPPEEMPARTSSTRKYICRVCGTSVRATRDVNINCNDCDQKMVETQ